METSATTTFLSMGRTPFWHERASQFFCNWTKRWTKKRLAAFPLAFYAARYWVDHVKFDCVVLPVKRAMEQLFNPSEPYLTAWAWIDDMDGRRFRQSIDELPEHPSAPRATALYYAALCGFSELADYLISTHGEDVNIRCGGRGTPLHGASSEGHLETVRILLDRGANVNIKAGYLDRTPLCIAHDHQHLEVMRLLLGLWGKCRRAILYLGTPIALRILQRRSRSHTLANPAQGRCKRHFSSL